MAISLNNSLYSAISGNPATVSFTVNSGSNRFLVVNVYNNASGDVITGITYNGVAMTRSTYVENTSAPFRAASYQYTLINPDTGTNNIVISYSSSTGGSVWVACLNGAKQSSNPEATTTNTGNGTSITTTLTVTSGAWGFTCVRQGTGATTITGGTNSTIFTTMEGNQGALYTNGAFPSSGSQSMTTNSSGSGQLQQAMISIAEAPSNLANLKTLDGIAKANIKTIDGIAIANVKTYNGIA